MMRHVYTLKRISDEIKSLVGCPVIDCFSQDKNTFLIAFYDGIETRHLFFSADTQTGCVCLRSRYNRAKKNSISIFPDLIGETLQEVYQFPADRILRLDFINTRLYFILYGGAANNAVLVNGQDGVIDSFKRRKLLLSSVYSPGEAEQQHLSQIETDSTVASALSRSFPGLGKYYSHELLTRLSIGFTTPLSSLATGDISKLEEEAISLKKECLESKKGLILSNDKGERILSLIRLHEYPVIIAEFDEVSPAIEKYISAYYSNRSFSVEFKEIAKKLESERTRLARSLERIKNTDISLEKANQYHSWGDLLLSHPEPKSRPGESVSLIAWSGEEITIPLDSRLNLIENSKKFFEKYRKSIEASRTREKRLPTFEKKLKQITVEIELLKKIKDISELEAFKKQYLTKEGNKMSEESSNINSKFKVFVLGDGYTLYVGKNAANNDELTMRFAKANDLWLHASGSGGSHAVLRLEKNQKPPKEILRKAAEITAWYSQARNASWTPVAYTFRKYVSKPKGSNPGSVVISREEVIMVKPGLPPQAEDDDD